MIDMGRKKGLDNRKVGSIISVLIVNPDGLWLRKLAEQTGLSPATVAHYVDTALKPLIEETTLGNVEKPLLRVIRLKALVLEKLQEGKGINDVMKIIDLIKKIE